MNEKHINPDWFKQNNRHIKASRSHKDLMPLLTPELLTSLFSLTAIFLIVPFLFLPNVWVLKFAIIGFASLAAISFAWMRTRIAQKVDKILMIHNGFLVCMILAILAYVPYLGEFILKVIPQNESIWKRITKRIYLFFYNYCELLSLFSFLAYTGYGLYVNGFGSRCADGWPSQSIGIQGACSHHGGVVSYGWINFVVGIAGGFLTLIVISSLTKVKFGYLVAWSTPLHPLEKELENLKFDHSEKIRPIPYKSSVGRTFWSCNSCRCHIPKGATYYYHNTGRGLYSSRIKYCYSCFLSIPIKNKEIQARFDEIHNRRLRMTEVINTHYNFYNLRS